MNWPPFFVLEGHDAYVWGAFGLSFALMAAEVFRLLRRIHRARDASQLAADEAPQALRDGVVP